MTFWATREVALERARICADCEHLFRPTKSCKKCGCFLKAKVRMSHQHCPIDRWLAVPDDDVSDPVRPPGEEGFTP